MIRSLGLRDGLRGWGWAEALQEQVAGPETSRPSEALRGAWLAQLLPWQGHWHIWIGEKEGRLLAALSARPRYSPHIWQVSHLLLAEGAGGLPRALFQRLTDEALKHGVEKVFLRLPYDSPLLPLAQEAQFSSYLAEYIYRQPLPRLAIKASGLEGQRRARARRDSYAIFLLYSSLAPPSIRQAEGLSYNEWCQSQERAGQEWVWERTGQLRGWVRAQPWRGGTLVESLFPPGEEAALLEWLTGELVQPVYFLAYDYQKGLQSLLESRGFHLEMENLLLLKRILVAVSQTCIAPARA